ncbi:MAG: ABC transporter substrate-binding protein [Actinomycetota bacterium]|nr:ABC transporter substrate-binding protein [Actinomycetota bacterium]
MPLLAAACGGGGTSSSTGSSTKPAAGTASSATAPAGCGPIAKKYPQFKGKTLVDALTPFTPGYEAANPSNPSTYVGFDVSLLHEISNCLGFKYTFKPMAFSSLIPTLQAGQANLVISDIFATKQRAKAVNFVTYEKVDDGILVRKGNPLHITAFNMSMCGARAAENTGFVEVPLVEKLAPACRAAGKPAPVVQQYGNNADCIQAVLAGRADFYANDVNTVVSAVKAHPGQLQKAATLQLPFSVGIAIAKPETALLKAVDASVKQIQADGIEKKLLAKWGLSTGSQETPTIVS